LKKLVDHEITLKPIRFRDKAEWDGVRAVNRDWLSPWEATRPKIESNSPLPSYYGMVMQLNKEIYWIDQRFASRGYTTRAVKLLTKFGFDGLKLHRIEINLRPENEASKKVAVKAGYVLEGSRNNYLHIAGDWRNHITFVKENPEIK